MFTIGRSGHHRPPWLPRAAMVTAGCLDYRRLLWLLQDAMVTVCCHGYHRLPWLPHVAMASPGSDGLLFSFFVIHMLMSGDIFRQLHMAETGRRAGPSQNIFPFHGFKTLGRKKRKRPFLRGAASTRLPSSTGSPHREGLYRTRRGRPTPPHAASRLTSPSRLNDIFKNAIVIHPILSRQANYMFSSRLKYLDWVKLLSNIYSF